MNKVERQNQVLDLLRVKGTISVEELSKQLNVTPLTIRRDLSELSERNLISRHYGGARLTGINGIEPPIIARAILRRKEKEIIGRAAAELINDGETVFLSGGTTTVEVAKHLVAKNDLTVITSAINIVEVFINYPQISVIVPGGTLVHKHLTLVGSIGKQAISLLRADKAVMGVSAIDINEGITAETLADAETDRAIIDFSPVVIVVADSSKFGLCRAVRVAPVNNVHYIVTDDGISTEDVESLRNMNIHIIVTSHPSN